MPSINIIKTGRIDDRDSAYPQAVQLSNGDILCSYSVGGGPNVHGGTDWSRSTNSGNSWNVEGTILPPAEDPASTNFLKLSISADKKEIYAYGTQLFREIGAKFGEGRRIPIYCLSNDNGRSWSSPRNVPIPESCPLEIPHGILAISTGRLLAPAATLPSKNRLGENVLVSISDNHGETWPQHSTVFQTKQSDKAFFEAKFTELPNGDLLATAWTATMGDYRDLENSYSLSHDQGLTWEPQRSTGIKGQTLSTCPLGGNRLLVLYNRRYGEQAIMMGLVTLEEKGWNIEFEAVLYDAHAIHERDKSVTTGVDEFDAFSFGFPTAITLQSGEILATHWSFEKGKCGIRWTRLQVDWPA